MQSGAHKLLVHISFKLIQILFKVWEYILAIVHFLYPKLGSFFNMEYYFYQLAYWDLKVPKH